MKRLRLRLFIILVLVVLTFGQRPEDDEDSVDDGLQEFAMSDDADASGDGSDDEIWITIPPDSVKNSSKSDIDKELDTDGVFISTDKGFPTIPGTAAVPVYVPDFQDLSTEIFVQASTFIPTIVPEPSGDIVTGIYDFIPKVHTPESPPKIPKTTEKPVTMPPKLEPRPPSPPAKVPIAKDEPATDEPPKTGGLSPGAIAGMIITSVIVLVVIIIVVICCKHKQQGYSRTQTQERV